MLKAKYFILLICLSFLLKAEAKVTLTSIWGDNMVLQQQSAFQKNLHMRIAAPTGQLHT